MKGTVIRQCISVAAVCFILAVITADAFNIDSIIIASSSASQGTMNVNYQAGIPGENDGKPVSNMTVTLLIQGFDNNTNSNRIFGMADVPNNPLASSNNIINGGAAYSFNNIPVLPDSEAYLVKTERNGRTWAEFGGSWEYASSIRSNNSFDDDHTFPILPEISNGILYGFVILNKGSGQLYENRLSGVTVTLYHCLPYSESDGIVNTGVVDIPNNPQVTAGGDDVGMYRFEGLTPGFYNVTVEKDGLVGHRVINFTSDEDNNNWVVNNIVLLQPSPAPVVETPTPDTTVTPTPHATSTSTLTVSPSTVPSATPQLPERTPTPTASATAVPASTDGFQTMLAITSMALACGIIFHKAKAK